MKFKGERPENVFTMEHHDGSWGSERKNSFYLFLWFLHSEHAREISDNLAWGEGLTDEIKWSHCGAGKTITASQKKKVSTCHFTWRHTQENTKHLSTITLSPTPQSNRTRGFGGKGGKKNVHRTYDKSLAHPLCSTAAQRFVLLPFDATPSNNLTAFLEPWPNLSSLAIKASQLARWRRWTQKQEKKLQLLQKYSVVKNTKELAVNIYIIYIFIYYIYVKNP